MKNSRHLLPLIALCLFTLSVTACAPKPTDQPSPPEIEVVGGVPEPLFHWLGSQLAMLKTPVIISEEHEDQIYILVTLGSHSRDKGQLTVADQTSSSDGFSLELVYTYPDGAADSLDTHFMILQACRSSNIEINLKDGVTKSDLAGFHFK